MGIKVVLENAALSEEVKRERDCAEMLWEVVVGAYLITKVHVAPAATVAAHVEALSLVTKVAIAEGMVRARAWARVDVFV